MRRDRCATRSSSSWWVQAHAHKQKPTNKCNVRVLMKRRDFDRLPANVSTSLPIYVGFQKGYRIDWSRSSRPKLTAALRSLSWNRKINLFRFTCLQIHTLNLMSHSRHRPLGKKEKGKEGSFQHHSNRAANFDLGELIQNKWSGGKLKYLIMKARHWSCRCEAERLRGCLLSLHMSYSYPVSAAIFPNTCVPVRNPCRALCANVW